MKNTTWTAIGLAAAVLATAGFAFALPAGAEGPGGGGGGGMGGPCMMGGHGVMWFDEDEDGRITLEEFRTGHDEHVTIVDVDRDGKVSWQEFQAAPERVPQARLQRKFQRIDGNGDGVLAPDEMEQRMQARFTRLDADGDGVITTEELGKARPAGHGGPGRGPGNAPGTPPSGGRGQQ